MKFIQTLLIAASAFLFAGATVRADQPLKPETLPVGQNMYVIEREIPDLGKLTPAELKTASQTSCKVLQELGPEITWLYSFVTGDKMYRVYLAPNEALVREHAQKGGFPANQVNRVTTIISPKTAE